MTVTKEDRKAFLELMAEVKGENFMIGWVKQSFIVPLPRDLDNEVLLSFREKLLADKLAGDVYNKVPVNG